MQSSKKADRSVSNSRNGATETLYEKLIEKIFVDRYSRGDKIVRFHRNDLVDAAQALQLALPKNLGDVVYSFRYRVAMPKRVLATQPKGMEWIIEGAGKAQYVFKLERANRIVPNRELVRIKIPDATPEIISAYALSQEQALLAKVRYNRLLDIFLGVAAYSLQNHLRSSVKSIGQIEIDEVYVGVDHRGCQFVLPVQAKGGKDQLSVVQSRQDMAYCKEQFPNLVCRPISAQFMSDDLIAMFELAIEGSDVKIALERHYHLVPASEITSDELLAYARRS